MKEKYRIWDKRLKIMITNENYIEIEEELERKEIEYYKKLGISNKYIHDLDEWYPVSDVTGLLWALEKIQKYNDIVLIPTTKYIDKRHEREVFKGDIYELTNYSRKGNNKTLWIASWDKLHCGYLLKLNIKMSFEGEEWFEEVTKPLSHIPGDQMKYLGNVYENPELLEQQQ